MGLQKRATWGPLLGTWVSLQYDSFVCVAHVVPNQGNNKSRKISMWRLQLWLVPLEESTSVRKESPEAREMVLKTTLAAGQVISEYLSSNTELVKISVAALDSELLSPVTKALSDDHILRMKTDYVSNCGLYSFSSPTDAYNTITNESLRNDFLIRNLTPSDADLVNSKWEYKSASSLSMLRTMIDTKDCCTLGVQKRGGELCAWILRYQDGPLGMLFCQDAHRRKGFSRALVVKATEMIMSRGDS